VRGLSDQRRDLRVGIDHIGLCVVLLSRSNYLGQQALASIILEGRINLADQLREGALSNLVALSARQV